MLYFVDENEVMLSVRHRSQPVAVAALGALGALGKMDSETLQFILRIIGNCEESAQLRKAAAQCLQSLCSKEHLRPMMEEMDVVPHMLQAATSASVKEDEAAIFKHAKNVASLLLDGQNNATLAKGLSYRQGVLEAIGCAAIAKVAGGRLGGVAAGMKYWGQATPSLHLLSVLSILKHILKYILK